MCERAGKEISSLLTDIDCCIPSEYLVTIRDDVADEVTGISHTSVINLVLAFCGG
jgi:hypothetical protein